MLLRNRTALDGEVLRSMFLDAIAGWPHEGLSVWVRYSRGAPFSGACYYATGRVYVNLGRANRYPYAIQTQVARARSDERGWRRELYGLEVRDAHQLALFIFLHEFYHWLVKRAGRNTRQKEAMCDRFAARELVNRYGARICDARGHEISRAAWDFQDLDGFVDRARAGIGRSAGRDSVATRGETESCAMAG